MIRLTSDNTHFVTAHQGLLTSDCDYFAEYFRNDRRTFEDKYVYGATIADRTISFKDGPNGNLPTLDVVKAFTQWLYTQVIPLPEEDIFTFLARAYIFGEKVIHPSFCNAIMDSFTYQHIRTRKLSFDTVIPLVYDQTAGHSRMRTLLADMYAYTLGEDEDAELEDVLVWFPKTFLMDAVAAMVRVRKVDGEGWWTHLEGAAYHYAEEEHEEAIRA